MPIYEYECRGCHHRFERLVRTGDAPACPSCQSADLERLLSHVAISSDQTRQLSFNKARKQADGVRRDREQAHVDYVKKHHDEHRQD